MKNLIRLVIGVFTTLVLLTSCQTEEQRLKSAEKVAQGFAVAWQNRDYGKVYGYFIPTLQEKRSKEDFIDFMEASYPSYNLIYDKVVLQDKNLAYAYYTYSGETIVQPKTPPIEIDYIKSKWGINGFADYFTSSCTQDCESKFRYEVEKDAKAECDVKFPKNNAIDDLKRDKCKSDIQSGKTPLKINYKCDKSTKYICVLVK